MINETNTNEIMYSNANINKLVKLLTQYNRPIENLIMRGGKMGIEEEEVINSMDLLFDLNVVGKEVVDTGDGWNTRGKMTQFFLK